MPALLAAGVLHAAAGCEPLPRYVAPQTNDPSVRIDEESELGAACPSALEACGEALTPPVCRASCQPTAEGCANVWELYRLDVLSDGVSGKWLGLAADGGHGIFARTPVRESSCLDSSCEDDEGGEPPSEYSVWTPEGVVPFSPAHAIDPDLIIRSISDDGRVVSASFQGNALYWTPATGVQPVPLESDTMARSGRLFAGWVDGRTARWSPGSNVDVVATGPDFASPLAQGDTALFQSSRVITLSPGTGEPIRIGLPADAPPDALFRWTTLAASGTSFATQVVSRDEERLYWWSDGVFERIDLPAYVPELSTLGEPLVSDDGQAVIFEIQGGRNWDLWHWSRQTGTQRVTDDRTFSIQYVSPSGDVILGHAEGEREWKLALRWSLDEGMVDTLEPRIPSTIALDGDVLVDTDSHGIRVLEYGRALDASLPIEHLRGRVMAEGPYRLSVHAVTSDARVVAGSARDERDDRALLWIARLQTVCPATLD